MTARLSECFPASGQMCLHKVPLLWIRYEVWLLEWKGKCFCPEVKAPQTQPGIPLKQLTVGLYTCGCRFSCGAVLPRQAFEFWKASNNNFSKRYWSIITGFVFGVLADLILKSGDYKSAKKGIISHGVFSMWIIGNYIPIVVTRDSYYQDLITGYSQEYADAIMGYISAYTLPLLLIAGFVCGVIGAIIGQKIFKKHFKRAGIA